MKRLAMIVAVSLVLVASQAHAQDRVAPAALGALSGVVVLGPFGLVAGAVIGYTAGPAIGRAWKIERGSSYQRPRPVSPARRATRVAAQPPAAKAGAAKPRATAPAAGVVAPVQPGPGTGGPPVQGME